MSRISSFPPGKVDLLALYAHATMLRVTYPDGQDYSVLAGLGAGAGVVADVGTRGALAPYAKVFELADSRILAIEGTTGGLQFVLQITGSYQIATPPWPGRVSAFLSAIAFEVWIKFAEYLRVDVPKPVFLIGHSLGACVAQMIAHKINLAYPGSVAGIVSFGCPRCGDAAFAAGATWPHLRVCNEGDLVPDLPPENLSAVELVPGTPFRAMEYRHSGTPYWLGVNGAPANPAMGNRALVLTQLGAFSFLPDMEAFSGPHSIREYVRRLRARLSKSLPLPWSFLDQVNERMNLLQGVSWAP